MQLVTLDAQLEAETGAKLTRVQVMLRNRIAGPRPMIFAVVAVLQLARAGNAMVELFLVGNNAKCLKIAMLARRVLSDPAHFSRLVVGRFPGKSQELSLCH
jgi:hypothetical protein